MHATPRNPSPASLCVLVRLQARSYLLGASRPPLTAPTRGQAHPRRPRSLPCVHAAVSVALQMIYGSLKSRQWTLTGSDQDYLGIPYGRSAYSSEGVGPAPLEHQVLDGRHPWNKWKLSLFLSGHIAAAGQLCSCTLCSLAGF
ncbi:uncharacterized protein BDW70DRAFT_138338 [Aspergillus foveolatus]|uniref:uncharacterized protein n=1 Tax=Aspergillus foveolatus TaxID=210207 RepID=UPI003CCD6FA5